MSDDVLVKVEGVSKKFCRSLKRSLWYGVQDVASEMTGRQGHHDELRKNEFWAVDDVSFELRRGECLGLIGPNGAGKSTLLKMLNGLVKPDKGHITMRGRVGALIELGAGFNPILTGRENIYINGSVLGFTKKEIDKKFNSIVSFAEIDEFIDTPVQNFSSGMKVRLGFAVASQLEPDVLLIDEVLAVGDVGFRMKCFRHLLKLIESGTSVIFVSHLIHQLSRLTNRVVVFDKGELIFDGGLSEGTGIYQKLFRERTKSNEKESDGSTYLGDIKLKDDKGNEKSEFSTGDSLFVEIPLHSNREIINARLVASIEAPSLGVLGSFGTVDSMFQFKVVPPSVTIELILPNLPLLVGGYFLNIHLYGPEIGDFYDQQAPGVEFKIIKPETNAFGFGVNHFIKFRSLWRKK